VLSTPTTSSKKLRQTNLSRFLTPISNAISPITSQASHYDTFWKRTPLADITNLSTNQLSFTTSRRPRVDSHSFPKIQQSMGNDYDAGSYHSSHRLEFVENAERLELADISDPEECGAEVSFVSNGSTLVSSSSQKCGFPMCRNDSFKSRVYTLKSGKRFPAYWCSNHKWCSKHDKYEMAGKCDYSTQISAKNNAKVTPHISAAISNDISPPTVSKSHPLVAMVDIWRKLLAIITFRTDTNYV
jgi:hypothetical protein